MEEFIKHMGENIFPQPFKELDKLFELSIMTQAAKQGLIVSSQAQVGLSPSFMKPLHRYIELSDKGWEKYEKLKQKQI